jgi:uncharacterized protein YyaL (SSP411 family)
VTEEGNFVDHSDPNPLPNQNVLSIANPEVLQGKEDLLASAKGKMFKARVKRVRPGLDDKVLAAWNGLMLGAVSRTSIVLGDESFRGVAERNVEFIRAKLWDAKTKTLYHRWRDGQRDNTQLLESYAFMLDGVIDLYEATLKPEHLDFAIALAESMVARFYDKEHGGFWQTTGDARDLILRVKDDYDGAEPSGNSVAAMSLLRLAAITERKDFRDAAEKTIQLAAERLQQLPQAVPFMLSAFDFAFEEPRRAVIVGELPSASGQSLLHAAHSVYQPNKVVLSNSGAVESFAKTLQPKDNKPTAYVCTGTACQAPTHDAEALKKALR